VTREKRSDGDQTQRRQACPFADEAQRVLKTPVGDREAGVCEQSVHQLVSSVTDSTIRDELDEEKHEPDDEHGPDDCHFMNKSELFSVTNASTPSPARTLSLMLRGTI
jgi:hypothetical protein